MTEQHSIGQLGETHAAALDADGSQRVAILKPSLVLFHSLFLIGIEDKGNRDAPIPMAYPQARK